MAQFDVSVYDASTYAPSTEYVLGSIASGERWSPLQPRVGRVPRSGLRPDAGGAWYATAWFLTSILSSEAWSDPPGGGVGLFGGLLGSIVSGESWASAPLRPPAVGLHPGAGLYPRHSGVFWANVEPVPGIESAEAWGDVRVSVSSARVFIYLALASALRRTLEVRT